MQLRVLACVLFVLGSVACSEAPATPADASVDQGSLSDGSATRDAEVPRDTGRVVPRCQSDVDCSDGLFCNGEERCAPANGDAGANGCLAGVAPCQATETCEEARNACRVTCRDADGDGVESMDCGGTDCDDEDATRYPGNTEICDSNDEDCNPATLGFVDADMDGAGSSACCNGPGACGTDCNDNNSDVRPGAVDGPPDRCNMIDDDCDGTVDESCPCTIGNQRACSTTPASMASTGLCRPGTQACVSGQWEMRCVDEVLPREERCDGFDNDCDGMTDENVRGTYYRDADGDGFGNVMLTASDCSAPMGYVPNSSDCRDDDNNVSPASSEVCNDRDDDCDGMTDEGVRQTFYRDADGDGYGAAATSMLACSAPAGFVTNNLDCDDTLRARNPAAPEQCNQLDDDCDGNTDPGCVCSPDGRTQTCGPSMPMGECRMGTQRCVQGQWAECVGAVLARTEVCNGVDDDCDGMTDELLTAQCYVDADSDGFGAGSASARCLDGSRMMAPFGGCPAGFTAQAGDCNDASALARPMGVEACNGADDDCDGMVDENVRATFFRDADNDGFGVLAMTMAGCTAPAGYVPASGDCNDADAAIRPGATEVCDGVDNNCANALADEPRRTFYRDQDADFYGNPSMSMSACAPPLGYVEYGGDCDDTRGDVRPFGTEVCDGADNDCDAQTDEAPAASLCLGQYPNARSVAGWACTSGACVPSCQRVGVNGDCNLLAADGCETDLYADPNNCGMCARSCGAGGSCSTGMCSAVTAVAAGGDTSCIVRDNGNVVCWGSGMTGEIGNGGATANASPSVVAGALGSTGVVISKYGDVTGGSVFATGPNGARVWGANQRGQLGIGSTAGALVPATGPALTGFAGSALHTCAVDSGTGAVRCFGDATAGQLGVDPMGIVGGFVSTPGVGLSLGVVSALGAGANTTCAATPTGVWCWGSNQAGQLGRPGGPATFVFTPQTAQGLTSAAIDVDVSAGQHVCAVMAGGAPVWCWGRGLEGQLGDGGTMFRDRPVQVVGLPAGVPIAEVATGGSTNRGFTCVRTAAPDARVWCWGSDQFGQLGRGTSGGQSPTPQVVPGLMNVTAISAGDDHVCAISAGLVYCWGSDASGQCGTRSGGVVTSPRLVPGT